VLRNPFFNEFFRWQIPAVLLSAFVGAASTVNPTIAIGITLGPIAGWSLVRSARFRVLWFVIGGMAVFQLPDAAITAKVAYLLGVLIVAGRATQGLKASPPGWISAFKVLSLPAALLFIDLVVTVTIGLFQNEPSRVLRDALPYVLVLAAPLVGLDAASAFRPTALYVLIALVSVLAAVGFASDWLSRRGVSGLPIGKFLLSTIVVGGLGFALALIMVTRRRGFPRLGWLITLALIPMGYLITGTRAALTMVVIIIAVIGNADAARAPLLRLLWALALVSVSLFFAFPVIADVAIRDPNFLIGRLASSLNVLQNGAASDASGQDRLQSYNWVLNVWQSNRLLGTGFGYLYPNGSLSLDTPLIILSKFGVIGSFVLVLFITAVAKAVRNMRRLSGPAVANSISAPFFFFVLALTPFISVFEDKGLAFAIALLIAAVGSAASHKVSEPNLHNMPSAESNLWARQLPQTGCADTFPTHPNCESRS
jgi:hypothetical protein